MINHLISELLDWESIHSWTDPEDLWSFGFTMIVLEKKARLTLFTSSCL